MTTHAHGVGAGFDHRPQPALAQPLAGPVQRGGDGAAEPLRQLVRLLLQLPVAAAGLRQGARGRVLDQVRPGGLRQGANQVEVERGRVGRVSADVDLDLVGVEPQAPRVAVEAGAAGAVGVLQGRQRQGAPQGYSTHGKLLLGVLMNKTSPF